MDQDGYKCLDACVVVTMQGFACPACDLLRGHAVAELLGQAFFHHFDGAKQVGILHSELSRRLDVDRPQALRPGSPTKWGVLCSPISDDMGLAKPSKN